jgi:hypothetical protein
MELDTLYGPAVSVVHGLLMHRENALNRAEGIKQK